MLKPLLRPCALAAALAPALAQNCNQTSVGFVPLSDLTGTYQGFPGRLYPGGNTLPEAHLIGGLGAAAGVVPRDAAGNPDPIGGKIVFLSIGMSNARMHFDAFSDMAANDPLRDPRVVVFNGAEGGVPAEDMVDPSDPYWANLDQKLSQAGLSAAQVQAVWLLQANRQPTLPFPAHAQGLQSQIAGILRIVEDRFPHTRLAYLSARIYAGYATSNLNPEPYAYEQAFACKWLIEQQMAGDPSLNYDPDQGSVEAPWIAWAPYMWADGLVPRSDGLIWECSDFQADGTHPGPPATHKVATALRAFMVSDPTAQSWYRDMPAPVAYGIGKVSSAGGLVTIGWSGVPSLTQDNFAVTLAGALPGEFVIGFFGFEPGRKPLWGGNLYVAPPLVRLPLQVLDATGGTSYPIPVQPGMVGSTIYYQLYTRDPNAADGTGVASSDALAVRFFD